MSDPGALLAKADKKAAGGGGFSLFGGGSSRLEEAADLYIQAANSFRIQSKQEDAARAFQKAAETQLKTDEKDDAANSYIEAFKCYRRERPEEAIGMLEKAIHLFTAKGGFRRAANYQMDLGQIYEDMSDLKNAMTCYDTASEWYANDQADALANKATLKTAELAAMGGDYARGFAGFERVARASLNNNLTKYSVKDYFFRAGLCRFADGDDVGSNRAVQQYAELDPTFVSTREFQLLQDISQSIEDANQEAFTDKIFQYDQMSKLDKWKTAILLKIKNSIADEPSLT